MLLDDRSRNDPSDRPTLSGGSKHRGARRLPIIVRGGPRGRRMKPQPAHESEHRVQQVLRRLGWGVADQAVSSISNFILGVIVAKSFGAAQFGAFSLAYVTYSMALNAARGLATDPLLVRFSGATPRVWRRATAAATATATLVGVVGGAMCVALGLVLNDVLGDSFVALGVCLPGLMLQDSWRFAFFAVGRGSSALVNDLVWTVLMVTGLLLLLESGHATVATCVLVFGGTANVAALFGVVQSRVVPRLGAAVPWVREHRQIAFRYLAENLSVPSVWQARSVVLGLVAGLAAVGNLRGAELLLGPFLVVLMGVAQVAVPEASRVYHRDPSRLTRFCFLVGAGGAVGSALWGLVLLVILPAGAGLLVLGPIWVSASHLLIPVNFNLIVTSFSSGANSGLRAMGVARRSLRAQLVFSAAYLVGSVGGAIVWGVQGAAWGTCVGSMFGAGYRWLELRWALADDAKTRLGLSVQLPQQAGSTGLS